MILNILKVYFILVSLLLLNISDKKAKIRKKRKDHEELMNRMKKKQERDLRYSLDN